MHLAIKTARLLPLLLLAGCCLDGTYVSADSSELVAAVTTLRFDGLGGGSFERTLDWVDEADEDAVIAGSLDCDEEDGQYRVSLICEAESGETASFCASPGGGPQWRCSVDETGYLDCFEYGLGFPRGHFERSE